MLCRPRLAPAGAGPESDVRSRDVSVASTAASSTASPMKTLQASPTFSQSQWQSMATKWQVSTESKLKSSEEKLNSSLRISSRHAGQISKMKTEVETIVTDTDFVGRETQTLFNTLAQVKHEVDVLSQHIFKAENDIAAQIDLKRHFHSLGQEMSTNLDGMQAEFQRLSLLSSEKFENVESKANAKKKQLDSLRGSLSSNEKELLGQYERLVLDYKEATGRIETKGQEILEKEKSLENMEEKSVLLNSDHKKVSDGFDTVQADLRRIIEGFTEEFEKFDKEEFKTMKLLQEGNKEREKLESDEREVSRVLETLEDETLDIKDCLGQSEDKLVDLLSSEKSLNEEISDAKRETEGLALDLQEIDQIKEIISNMKVTLETSEEERVAAAKKVENLSVIENLKGQLDENNVKLCQDIYSLEAAVSSKMMEVAEIKDQVKARDLESEENGKTLEQIIKEDQTTEQELAQAKEAFDQAAASSAQLSEKLRSAETSLNEESSLPQDQMRLEEAKMKLDNIKKESVQLGLLIEERTKSGEEIARQVDELKANMTSRKSLLEEMTQRIQTASEQESGNKVSDKALKSKLKSLETRLKKLEKEIKSQCKETDGLDVEREELEKALVKTEEIIKDKAEDCNTTEEAITMLKESLSELETRESNAKSAAEMWKKKLEVKKKLEKDLSKEKKILIGANKNKEKMSKQFNKSTNDKTLIESSKEEQKKNLEEILNLKESLTFQLSNIDDQLSKSGKAALSQGDGKKNLKLVESVLKKFEKEKADVQHELKCKVQEYNGILVCRDNDHNESFKRLNKDVDEAKAHEEDLSCQLRKAQEELKRIEEAEVNDDKIKALKEKRLSLQELQSHLKEKEQEGSKLLTKLDTLKQTDSPAPSSKFFKTPRNLSIYRSPITPSPRKKLAKDSKTSPVGGNGDRQPSDNIVPLTPRRSSLKMASASGRSVSASPMRSFLAPPRKSPVKGSRLAQVSSVSRTMKSPTLDLMSMSDSSQ